MNKEKKLRVIGGAIVGTVIGVLFGTFLLGLSQTADEILMGSYADIIIYAFVGVVTGVVFGYFAKPSYNAIQGGILGCVIAVSFKGLAVIINLGSYDTLAIVLNITNAAIAGFGIGGIVGGVVWFISDTQKRIAQAAQHSRNALVEPQQAAKTNRWLSVPLEERKYSVGWWQKVLNFLPIFYFVPLTAVIAAFSLLFIPNLQSAEPQLLGIIILVCLGSVLILMFCFCLFIIASAFFYAFGTYLKISFNGIEYLRWPYYGVRCTWDEVERLERRSLRGKNYDILYLRGGEPLGWQILAAIRRKFGISTRLAIPLTGFQGWPTGQLADDLCHYLPQIFSDETLPNKNAG